MGKSPGLTHGKMYGRSWGAVTKCPPPEETPPRVHPGYRHSPFLRERHRYAVFHEESTGPVSRFPGGQRPRRPGSGSRLRREHRLGGRAHGTSDRTNPGDAPRTGPFRGPPVTAVTPHRPSAHPFWGWACSIGFAKEDCAHGPEAVVEKAVRLPRHGLGHPPGRHGGRLGAGLVRPWAGRNGARDLSLDRSVTVVRDVSKGVFSLPRFSAPARRDRGGWALPGATPGAIPGFTRTPAFGKLPAWRRTSGHMAAQTYGKTAMCKMWLKTHDF